MRGVTFLHPGTARVEAGVTIGGDTVVGPGVSLLGDTVVGGGCTIGPHTTARRLPDRRPVQRGPRPFSIEVEVQDGANIGPFAYLRPGTVVRHDAKVGTFVEVKNSDIGEGAKVPHLSYIGDADVGDGRQPRRQHHHRQLRRPAQAPHEARKEREDRRPHVVRSRRWTSAIGRTLGPAR